MAKLTERLDFTTSYQNENRFTVDIVQGTMDNASVYEAWIGHEDWGIKEMIIGCPVIKEDGSTRPLSEFLETVESVLDEHIKQFVEVYHLDDNDETTEEPAADPEETPCES